MLLSFLNLVLLEFQVLMSIKGKIIFSLSLQSCLPLKEKHALSKNIEGIIPSPYSAHGPSSVPAQCRNSDTYYPLWHRLNGRICHSHMAWPLISSLILSFEAACAQTPCHRLSTTQPTNMEDRQRALLFATHLLNSIQAGGSRKFPNRNEADIFGTCLL